ncbi:MAG TPA: hypothetical protein VHY31_01500 [Streptosporangiaceae bacterium]|jgi:hypothetical protein|nr:hypothetical protein [Streptosporangiaceae bacterium]
MKIPHLRLMAGTAVTAATLATAVGLFATTANAAPVIARGSTATAAAPAAQQGTLTSTVAGTFSNADGQGKFAGTFTPTKFSVVNGVLEATGLLKGTMTDANGAALGTVSQTATIPVDRTAAPDAVGCNVLNLTLGPLNLNLLGLVVTLNQVHLTITAVPGAGNLLGNLLCAVANLLNGTGSLSAIAALLSEILALL